MTLLIWILLAIILLSGLVVAAMTRAYKNPRKPHQMTPADRGIDFREVRFPTKKNRQLYGWWIPAPAHANHAPTLILVHGWGRNVERMLPYIEHLHPAGYNLLAFDSRNHGSSDPDDHSSLVKFTEDILAALDYLQRQHAAHTDAIGILGVSLGGAAAIYAASLDQRIKAVVTVGAFAHPAELMRLEFRRRHIPYFPLVWLLFQYIQIKIGAKFDQIAPVNNIARVQAKILLIHGSRDTVVPPEQGEKLKAAANPATTELWIVPDKGHSDCHTHLEFWQKVDAFLHQVFMASAVQ